MLSSVNKFELNETSHDYNKIDNNYFYVKQLWQVVC